MGVKVPDFTSHMPMLHSSRTFSLPRPIVERHEVLIVFLQKRQPSCLVMTFEIFRNGVMTFRSSREHCGRLDCACSAKRELALELFSEILRARVDGSDMASFDGVVLVSLVAQVKGIRFSDFGVSGARACRGESVVVGRRPDNVHDVWHSRLSTSKHYITPCLRHTDVVFIGQLKLVDNSFSNLALLQLFYKYTCIVVSSCLMDHG